MKNVNKLAAITTKFKTGSATKLGRVGFFALMVSWALATHAGLPLKTESGFEIGYQYMNYRYDEVLNDGAFINLKGIKHGFTGSATGAFGDSGYYARLDGRAASGSVEYEGSGIISGAPDSFWELRALLGKDVPIADTVLSFYAGTGIRKLFNDLRGTSSTGRVGYRRESTYIYIPLGGVHRFSIGQSGRIATSLEYDYLLQGSQITYYTDMGYPETDNASNRQRRGHGLRASLDYEFAAWSVGLFWNMWKIPDSEKETLTINYYRYSVYEPSNTTKEVGIQFKLRFY